MKVAGAYVTVSTGAGELVGAAPDVTLPASFRYGVANSADQLRERVRIILNGGADFIKILATGAVFTRGTKPGVSEYTEAADLMQWKDSVGSLTAGKYADIIAVEGDALADLRSFEKVGFVMKGGVVYKSAQGEPK